MFFSFKHILRLPHYMLYFSALAMSFAIGLNTLIVIHVVLVPAFQCTICLKSGFWCVTHPISPSSAGTGVISLSLSPQLVVPRR